MTSARRGIAAIIGGTAGAQLLGLATAPLISRLFPPSEYGPFAVVNAVALPLTALLAMRLDLAIPRVRDDQTSLRLARLGLEGAAVMTLLGVFLAVLLRGPCGRLLKIHDPVLLAFIPIIGGCLAMFTVLNQVAIRYQRYSAVGRRNLLQGFAVAVGQLCAGLAGAGAWGLAAGFAFGQLVGVISLFHSLRDLEWPPLRNSRRGLLTTYREYPLLMAPSGLVNTLGLQAPVIMVASLYGAHVSGWLGMTQRILSLPVSLIGVALSQVFLGEFGSAHRSGDADLRHLFITASKRLAAASMAVGLLVMVLGPGLFAVVLGEQWRTSGQYAQALAMGMAGQMVAAPLSQTLTVLGKVRAQAAWDVARLVACVGAVELANAQGASALAAMWWLGLATVGSYAASWLLSFSAVRECAVEALPQARKPVDDAPEAILDYDDRH